MKLEEFDERKVNSDREGSVAYYWISGQSNLHIAYYSSMNQ